MDLTAATMRKLFFSFNAFLQRGLGGGWNEWTRFCSVINSGTLIEKYPMTVITGGMREWIGERVINEISGKLFEVVNRDFEHTEGVSRNDIEDDNLGFYQALFTEMGINAANLWPELAVKALTGTGKWADGVAFFSATRKIGKAVINNVVSGELTVANYETARAQMMQFCKPDGKTPLGLVPDTLMVGPQLEVTARKILKADLIIENNTTVSNVHRDECEILVNPLLTGDNAGKWYLMNTKRGIKPVVVQQRKIGPLVRWDKDSDSCVKDHNRNEYGLHYRGAAALVAPQLIVGGNLG